MSGFVLDNSVPMRCRITLPAEEHRPKSSDPKVHQQWSLARRAEGYSRVVASWRAQSPRAVVKKLSIKREGVTDKPNSQERNMERTHMPSTNISSI